jgi:uncharacterized membrane protein
MLSSPNFWMCFAGLTYLIAGVCILRKDIAASRGWDKLIALGPVFIAASLAAFAPEHFRGPDFIQSVVPSYMPVRWFWPYFIGCALLAAATSLILRKCVRLSSTLLGLMFFLFVCMIYAPFARAHPANRFAWAYVLRDLSFSAGACALAGLHRRATSPQLSKAMILFGRIVITIAAIFYGVEHFLHPKSAPGVPLELMTPSWVPIPSLWAYLAGATLLASGLALALNKKPRIAAASIGAVMTIVTVFLYLVILLLAHGGPAINEAINYVADTLLYAGSALALASALPRDTDHVQKT